MKYGDKTVEQTITVKAKSTGILGDMNGNGVIDFDDAGLIYAYYNGREKLTEEQLARADVNGDGNVNYDDAGLVYAFYNGKLEAFPAG